MNFEETLDKLQEMCVEVIYAIDEGKNSSIGLHKEVYLHRHDDCWEISVWERAHLGHYDLNVLQWPEEKFIEMMLREEAYHGLGNRLTSRQDNECRTRSSILKGESFIKTLKHVKRFLDDRITQCHKSPDFSK